MTEWKRKENRYHMISHEGKDGLTYLTFPVLDGAENVRHLFSTRKGGVSRGIYESMNLSFHRGDDAENVLENFRRIAALFDSTPEADPYHEYPQSDEGRCRKGSNERAGL